MTGLKVKRTSMSLIYNTIAQAPVSINSSLLSTRICRLRQASSPLHKG